VAIASKAFTPAPGISDTDVTTAVGVIKLPSTITAIAADSFSGDFSSMPQVNIPPEVLDLLLPEVRQALGDSVILAEVTAYSVPASEAYGKFPGTKTVDELHAVLDMPPYAVGKYDGMILYLDENLTQEINGSTAITRNTRLYVSAEGIMPEITSYPGLDTANWPQDPQLNGTSAGGVYKFHFRTSANGKALLCIPLAGGTAGEP
jgi:hypothetical protein